MAKLALLQRLGIVDLKNVGDPLVQAQIERILTRQIVNTLVKFKRALPGSGGSFEPDSDGSVF